jgi:hypothetical protein
MDTYLCTPTLDISQVTDPVFSFLVNYQAADNRLNDNGTPMDPDDDFDDDFLRILVGDVAPNAQSVPNYTDLGSVFDHLDSSLALSKPGPFSASLAAQNALAAAHVCFNYRGTYAWFAQIDNAALRGSSCDAAPDADADGVPDSTDNCTDVANPLQIDSNGDGIGNICDADLNDDCNVNFLDLGIMKSVFFTNDPDADLVGAGNSESDGVVNFFDLGKMKELFFQAPGPSAAGCN